MRTFHYNGNCGVKRWAGGRYKKKVKTCKGKERQWVEEVFREGWAGKGGGIRREIWNPFYSFVVVFFMKPFVSY